LILSLLAGLSTAQGSERPTIGIALGGGSARGIAHVGVLEWLEEHQIPVDFVAGTSMGGLVGGSYATGMTPTEVRELLRSVDWDLLFLGEAPYPLKSFRRKEDRREFPVKLELGLKGGLKVPSGLDPAHQIGLLLSRIALPYSTLPDFDALPTPFRCVATDMEQAEVVVLGKGSLTQALLATMAIPGMFPPVKRDGQTLSDGGLLNNVPADVVRAMGAELVIAVNVSAIEEGADLDSAFTAASQAVDVMIAAGTRKALEDADLVIVPDLTAFGSFDWRRSDDIADVGYAAAEAQAGELEAYRLDDAAWAEYLEARRSKSLPERLEPEFVTVTGADERFASGIEKRLRDFVGVPLDVPKWHEELTALTGTQRFESLRYEQTVRGDARGLLVLAKEKSYGPPFMRFKVGVTNENQDIDFNFGARLSALDVGKTGAEVRIDGDIGARMGAGAEYTYPLLGRFFFVAPRASYFREVTNQFEGDDLVANRRDRRAVVGIDVGLTSSKTMELRLGYHLADVESKIRVGDPELPQPTGRETRARARFVYDGQNAPIIPTRGLRTLVAVEWFEKAPEAERPFGRGRIDVSGFIPRGEKDSIFLLGRAGVSFGGTPPFFYDFKLGGPLSLSAFELDAFRGDNLLYGAVGYLKALGRLPDVMGGPVYLTGLVEAGSVFDDFDTAQYRFSAGGGLVVDTALGPLFAIVSGGSGGELKFYFTLGGFLNRLRR